MKRCLFTYELIDKGDYSQQGLKKLNPRLKNLGEFPYDLEEQILEVQKHAVKMSIQGVQPKLSAKLSVRDETFILVNKGGEFIIKPQVVEYPELVQNEDLTMHLAKLAGLDVPWHGLIRAKDNSLLYTIKRFDRLSKNKKLLQEDFAQLLGATRSTKYQANMEKVCEVIERYASFPLLELEKVFKLTVFSFLIGNEDLHLKNFSMQMNLQGVSKLTPVYDLVNSTIILAQPQEEMALELNGKKKGLNRKDFIQYFAPEHCYILKETAEKMVSDLLKLIPSFEEFVKKSFLSYKMKEKYIKLLHLRAKVLSE